MILETDTELLRELLEIIRAERPAGEARWRVMERSERERKVRAECRRRFAERHGWRETKWFSPSALARRHYHSTTNWQEGPKAWPNGFLDHAEFYRTIHDRRAASVVSHLYGGRVGDVGKAGAWLAEMGLRAAVLDETSWWYPGATKAVLIEPIEVERKP